MELVEVDPLDMFNTEEDTERSTALQVVCGTEVSVLGELCSLAKLTLKVGGGVFSLAEVDIFKLPKSVSFSSMGRAGVVINLSNT